MNERIIETIRKYEEPGDFNYATVTDEMILAAEKTLHVKLPEQYIEFLKMFGHGGICGMETLGVGLTGKMIFAEVTTDYREEGLPENYIVIENIDEWLMCIDCRDGKIVSWDFDMYVKEEYACFDEYLLDQMNIAAGNT